MSSSATANGRLLLPTARTGWHTGKIYWGYLRFFPHWFERRLGRSWGLSSFPSLGLGIFVRVRNWTLLASRRLFVLGPRSRCSRYFQRCLPCAGRLRGGLSIIKAPSPFQFLNVPLPPARISSLWALVAIQPEHLSVQTNAVSSGVKNKQAHNWRKERDSI